MSNSFATPGTLTCQVPVSMKFPRQEYWSGLPFPSPEDLPDPRTELAFPALAGRFFTTEPHRRPLGSVNRNKGLCWWLSGKELPANAEDAGYSGSINYWGRPPGVGNGNLFQYSCLNIPWTEEPGKRQSMG